MQTVSIFSKRPKREKIYSVPSVYLEWKEESDGTCSYSYAAADETRITDWPEMIRETQSELQKTTKKLKNLSHLASSFLPAGLDEACCPC